MSDLTEFIDQDKAKREQLEAMLQKAKEFLEAHGYEVLKKGTLAAETSRTTEWMLSSVGKAGSGYRTGL